MTASGSWKPVFIGDTLTALLYGPHSRPGDRRAARRSRCSGRRRARRRGRAPHEVAATGRMTPLLAGRRAGPRRGAPIRRRAHPPGRRTGWTSRTLSRRAGHGDGGARALRRRDPRSARRRRRACLAYAVVMEELARGYASVADQCGLVELVGTLLAAYGTPEQQDRYLRPLLEGRTPLRLCAHRGKGRLRSRTWLHATRARREGGVDAGWREALDPQRAGRDCRRARAHRSPPGTAG